MSVRMYIEAHNTASRAILLLALGLLTYSARLYGAEISVPLKTISTTESKWKDGSPKFVVEVLLSPKKASTLKFDKQVVNLPIPKDGYIDASPIFRENILSWKIGRLDGEEVGGKAMNPGPSLNQDDLSFDVGFLDLKPDKEYVIKISYMIRDKLRQDHMEGQNLPTLKGRIYPKFRFFVKED